MAPNSRSASAAPSTASTSPSSIEAPEYASSCSRVPSASRNEPVAERAISAHASSGIAIDSASAVRRRTFVIWATVGRLKSKRWQRSTTVGSTLLASVVASTKIVCGGGSSSVLRNAFQAAVESMCASSRM